RARAARVAAGDRRVVAAGLPRAAHEPPVRRGPDRPVPGRRERRLGEGDGPVAGPGPLPSLTRPAGAHTPPPPSRRGRAGRGPGRGGPRAVVARRRTGRTSAPARANRVGGGAGATGSCRGCHGTARSRPGVSASRGCGRPPRGGRPAPPRRRRTPPAGGTGRRQPGSPPGGTGRSLDEGPERSSPRPDDRLARPRVPGPLELGLRRHARGPQPVPAPGNVSISPTDLPDHPCTAS